MNNLIFSTKNIDNFISDVANEVVKRISEYYGEGTCWTAGSQDNDGNPFLDTDEAAKFIKRKKSTIYSKVCRGELPHIKKDGKLIFERQKLIEYLESGRVLSDAEIKENAHNYLTTKKKGLNNG